MRLYVRDNRGTPGVFFISLDCDRKPAVWLARTFFGLPYRNAKIDFSTALKSEHANEELRATCQITSQKRECSYIWKTNDNYRVAIPGTLDFFLTERYYFFVERNGSLQMGEVRHDPYRVCTPEIVQWSADPFIWNKLPEPAQGPVEAHYSAGVDITAFSLRAAD